MTYFYALCALVGGTVMFSQFILSVVGWGSEMADAGLDDLDVDPGDMHDGTDADHASSTWLFGVITFRTVVAAVTFFGLVGLAADAAHWRSGTSFIAAVTAGVAAMYLVHGMMQSLTKLREDATAQIEDAIGRPAHVYLRIPGGMTGTGKVQVAVAGRQVEYLAQTAGDAIPTGAHVQVVAVLGSDTLEVAQDKDSPAPVAPTA